MRERIGCRAVTMAPGPSCNVRRPFPALNSCDIYTYTMSTLFAVAILLLIAASSSLGQRHHPQHLSHVAPGVMAAGLYHKPGGRHHSHGHHQDTQRRELLAASQPYQGQRMPSGRGMGIYTVDLIFNGYNITALVDTGSGVPQLACSGATVDPSPKYLNGTNASPATVYNPNVATPPFNLIPRNSTNCSLFCASSYNGSSCWSNPSNPSVSGSCE